VHARYALLTRCNRRGDRPRDRSPRRSHRVTGSTGTVHTFAKARLTSAAIRRISMSSRYMSVNHFPYLPIVTNPENNPDGKSDSHRNLTICLLAHCQTYLKSHANRFVSFCAKLPTVKQTNSDENNISSLEESNIGLAIANSRFSTAPFAVC